ncbi:oligosaccharide flippase family protein [Leptolyngbya sp. 7M]|uniref:oligosaccharide flippase family protein n=1 Tax=Leptolyngbya sp. 7M TaxID=2812896 RepID=UPI001B8BE8A2|nr:oligosaccharide flippase family protein [Leptolyngbya sp. 7M]QYO67036.1 oligosaccharide flippase family protein [Leptolyngbya sp. 7M]
MSSQADSYIRESKEQKPTLKQRAIRGSIWTFLGYGSSQILRLGGNLVLTRLLFPEAFGLMALVQTFLTGLQMFSDLGIFPSIVHSKRGEDPAFLNTAWTLQVIRGIVLWIGTCIIAAPIARFYDEPMLMQLLPVAGLSALIDGTASTKLATANRQLALKQLTTLEISIYAISLSVMIVGAWLYRSVWVLLLGGLIGSLLKSIASHVLLKGERNSFCWDKEAFHELQQFGQWIFLSTIIAFFALQGDRLVLGWLLDVRFLGIYTVALGLSSAVESIVTQMNSKVLFPSYAELIRERPAALYRVLRKARLILMALSSSFAIFLVLFGKPLIDLLYDERYLEAGWILRVLAIGFLGRVLSVTYEDILLAKGQTFKTMLLTSIGALFQLNSMLLGYSLAGPQGVIIGIAVTEWLTYIAYALYFNRLSLWQPELDFPVVALAGCLTLIVYYT